MPPVRRFGRVRLVAEEVCAAPVQKLLLQKHWRHLQAEIVLVPEWNPAHVESVLSSLASDENTLLALVPSWLTPASVTCHFPNASGVPVFKAKPSLGPRLPGVEDAEKGIEVIKTFMRAIEASATDCVSVVLLPALPLHCSFDGFFTTVAEAVLPPALLLLEVAQVMCRRVFASYRSFSNAICLEALASFTKESLQCNALLALIEKTKDLSLSCKSKASGSQNVYTSELYSQGNSLPDVTAILFGLFCRTLHEMIFTATSAYPFQPLPDIEELNFCGTYPELSHLADLSSKSRRFKKVIIVGDAAARSKISEELGGKERIQLLPTPLFSDSSILELLELLSLEPPNVLVLFLLDVTLFAVKEVYPDCLTKKCSDKILRCHLSSSVDWEDDAAVQTLVASKLESIISYLQQMKQCLPHQSNVLLLPVAPERLLLQTEAKSFWNHTLLHATFWLPSSGNAMAYGDLKHWNVLYHTLAQELNKPQYQIDPGMSALLTPLRKDLEPQLSYSSNPRLYVEDQFTERMQWRQLCKDLLNKAFKLVFPVVGILEEDLNKADAIMNTKNPEWEIKLEEADSHVPPPENSTSSYTGPSSVGHSPPASSPISNRVSPTPISTKEFESTGSSGFLGEPREVVIESGYAELPLSFVQALLVPFEPLTEITRVEPRSYRVALPDTIRTALLVALLHNFRCCFVHITVSVLDFEGQTLPQCPSREKFRLQQLLMPKLKLFASSCDNKYSQNIKIDDAFLKSREEEHDYVEGLDATLPYLHRELQYLHFHHQQSIRDGKVLVIVVTSTAEDAGILHFTLAGSLQDSARFPVGPGTASLSFVTRDSKQTAGNVVIGTVRFVLSIVRSGADPSCVQLIIVEELKAIMTSQDKGPLLEIIAWLQAANDTVRPVLVSRRSCLQELSGGNALFRCQLRLITRSETGAAVMREYDRTSLPRVMISGFPPPRSFSNGPNYGGSLPPKPVAHPLGSWPRLGPCSDLRSLYPNVRNVRPPSIVPGCRPLTVSSCVPPTVHDPNTRALTSVDHDIRSPASSHGAPPLTRGPNAYHVMESGFRPPAFRPNVRPLAPEPGVHSLASRPGVRLPVIGPNTRISGLGPSIRPSSAGLGINPPAPRHGVCPPDMDPNTRPPMMAPNTRPPMMAPNTRPPMTGPNTRPPMTDPNTRTPMAGPNTRPPMTGPNTRPPMTGPNTRPPMSGPNTRPHMMGPNTRPAMMGPVNKQLVSGSGIRPSLGPIANAGPSRNSFSYSTTGFNGRPPLRPNDGLSTSSGHYPVPASLRQSFQQPQGLRVRPPLGCIPPPPPPGTSLGDPYGGAAIRPSNSAGALSYSGISRGAQINKPSDAGVGWNSSSSAVGHKAGTGYEKYDPFAEDSSDSKKRYRSRSQSPSQGFMRSSSSAGKEVGKKFRPDGDHSRAPLSTSLTSEEESRMRTELEVEFKTYETSPELHPNYSEHREVFMDLYEEKMVHKEGSSLEQEWSTVWKRVLADLMEEEFSERKNALIAAKTNRASRSAAHAISSTSNSHNASQKYDNETSRNKWAAESSSDYYCEQSNYDNSVGYAANKESYGTSAEYGDAQKMYDREGRDQAGAGVSSYDSSSNYQSWDAKKGRESQMYYNSSRPDDKDGNGSEQHWHHPDLDPATLAERTRGLSTMEVAVLIKQLLKDKNIPQPEQMFKKIYSAVSDLHLKYVEEQLSM